MNLSLLARKHPIFGSKNAAFFLRATNKFTNSEWVVHSWHHGPARRQMTFTAVYRQVPEGYIGFVEELPGANTQEPTLEEARESLAEAVELGLEANRLVADRNP